MTNQGDIKRLFEAMEAAAKINEAAEAFAIEHPENPEADRVWDDAYNAYYTVIDELAQAIARFTKQAVDFQTARKMAVSKQAELKALCERMTA